MCVVYPPLINVVFLLGCWFLGSWLKSVLTVFHRFVVVLGSPVQKHHHRYRKLLYFAMNTVIVIRCQRGSISIDFCFCLFWIFQVNSLLYLPQLSMSHILWAFSLSLSTWIELFKSHQGLYILYPKGVVYYRLKVVCRSSWIYFLRFIGIVQILWPPWSPCRSLLSLFAIQNCIRLNDEGSRRTKSLDLRVK